MQKPSAFDYTTSQSEQQELNIPSLVTVFLDFGWTPVGNPTGGFLVSLKSFRPIAQKAVFESFSFQFLTHTIQETGIFIYI